MQKYSQYLQNMSVVDRRVHQVLQLLNTSAYNREREILLRYTENQTAVLLMYSIHFHLDQPTSSNYNL